MPFEPAPKESPAARLAALIELGKAMNPDLKFNGRLYFDPFGPCGCAMMFAALGSGVTLREWDDNPFVCLRAMRDGGYGSLVGKVEQAAYNAKSLDEICLSLREGELAKVTA